MVLVLVSVDLAAARATVDFQLDQLQHQLPGCRSDDGGVQPVVGFPLPVGELNAAPSGNGAYGTSNYVGNFGGPAAIALYTGTIVPLTDQLGIAGAGANVGPVGLQSVTDGTSNTALFSEHLYGLQGSPTITLNSPDAKRGIFTSGTSTAANTGPTGAQAFVASCKALPGSTTSSWTVQLGYCWIYGYPLHVGITSYMHYGAPNSVPCNNPADPSWLTYGAPQGSISATSNHSGGVNVGFTDGSVKFIKDSISLPTWWALGSRKMAEVISSDAY